MKELQRPRRLSLMENVFTAFSYLMFATGVALVGVSFFIDPHARPPSGEGLPVRTVTFLLGGLWTILWGVGILYSAVRRKREEDKRLILLEHGIFGEARVAEIFYETDEDGNRETMVLKLDVMLEGHAAYRCEERLEYTPLNDGRLWTGTIVKVIAAPVKPGLHKGALRLLV